MDWPVLMSSNGSYFIISRRYCGEDETLPSDLRTKYSALCAGTHAGLGRVVEQGWLYSSESTILPIGYSLPVRFIARDNE